MDADVTKPPPRPDDVRFDAHDLVGTRMEPAAISRLTEMARTMLAACDGPEKDRPSVTSLDCVGMDEPGCSFAAIANGDATIGLVCPLSAPEGHDASSLLRLVIRACEAMCEIAPHSSIDDSQKFVTAVFVLSRIGSLAIGSGAIAGGTGSIVHGPSPFGPAFILDTVRGKERKVEFDARLPVSWTADIHSTHERMMNITLHGISYEPDPEDVEDPIATMRGIADTGIGPALETLRSSREQSGPGPQA